MSYLPVRVIRVSVYDSVEAALVAPRSPGVVVSAVQSVNLTLSEHVSAQSLVTFDRKYVARARTSALLQIVCLESLQTGDQEC